MREAEPLSIASLRQALANLASGVTITAYGAPGPLGLAATSFVSESLFARYS